MPVKIAVLAKQVIDPEMPMAAFRVDSAAKVVVTPPNIPPVVNGFDENAVEAALRIKDAQDVTITVISSGTSFALDVMKKPLSMGADDLYLLQDDAFANTVDSFFTAQVLAAAIRKLEGFDLVICGRQASDWDNAQVPLGIAEILGLSCITLCRKVDVTDGKVVAERVIPDGYEVLEASLPALVTVSNELGQPRYPTLRGIMAATRKRPTIWAVADLGIEAAQLQSRVTLHELFVPERTQDCEIIEGENDADAGRQLALKLREAKLL
ncbi:MAG: electron transfer flavoprotein subunit beta/FixA family protein [Dehalococcoidia bacterium]|jgi:electron transfer flavoprotein beta subunit|nr:electron transfer flavoprotein subunit beta/FixA family protein [Dehalococcoidia bacterium]MDP6227030.1 electron transfer flavoprotein subunit beta/FixA family protein [Dehalococcoidia bacterium]MDP7083652.1 electron transfer flavoprotein subunit beta/FixA family protein [Dehalococcoidia bacterium]MDP7199530.1 electron transfer flavoprotein subunit beta/FixA family protein [Dehalococcoidia bacterium]MDP7510949.1 electron transfer flavoprotein subunit beta/FixA family protein [Dehalococcoidia